MARLLLILVAFLALAGPAAAQDYVAIGQRPAGQLVVQRAVRIGERYWHARGVQPCSAPTVYSATSLNEPTDPYMAFERAEQPGCHIWLLGWTISAGYETDRGARFLCRLVLHALGHTAGLGHAARGVMNPMLDPARPIRGPRPCVGLRRGVRPRA